MTRTRALETSRLAVALFAICLAATSAASQEGQEAQGTQENREVAGDAVRPVPDREFPVPATAQPGRPEGVLPRLDALLHLPSGFVTTEPRVVAGAVESEWRRRFTKADRDLSEARTRLKDTKRELDGIASAGGSSQWSIAPPGGESSPTTSPLSFKLRQQLRDDRERIAAGEKASRELRIEADLAGVPQSWRAVDANSAEPDKN